MFGVMDRLDIRVLTPINVIGFVLVVMAGWIDTISLLIFLDKRTSSMTGRAAKLGLMIFEGESDAIQMVFLIILSFIIGACISTLITRKVGLLGGLSFTSIMLILTTLSTVKTGLHLSLITIPMAMGSLNAATSLTAINRTTHLTGASTDIGINLAKGNWNGVIFWSLRWVGFLTGTIISLNVIHIYNNNLINRSTLLIIPAIIIILTGIIQKRTINIPLLEDIASV